MDRGQRVVVVIALGVATWCAWAALDQATSGLPGGWPGGLAFNAMVAPDVGGALQRNAGLRLVVQLAFVAAWSIASVWVLHEPDERRRARKEPFQGLGPVVDDPSVP